MLPNHADGNAALGKCGCTGEADQATADDNDFGAQLICLF
jgi:hypothetical protein